MPRWSMTASVMAAKEPSSWPKRCLARPTTEVTSPRSIHPRRPSVSRFRSWQPPQRVDHPEVTLDMIQVDHDVVGVAVAVGIVRHNGEQAVVRHGFQDRLQMREYPLRVVENHGFTRKTKGVRWRIVHSRPGVALAHLPDR